MITSTITGSKIAAAAAPGVGKATVFILSATMGIGVLVGLSLVTAAGGFYVCRKLCGVAAPIT
ncbi:hypothetical protein [Paramagnetospirillum magneticum]|uniref:hypothetical protein n=1 Tax=Paramagnetospirillum magneticum TaxID=84159 RepID=UPI0011D09F9E|nr:hypothetical protein [Paramagnetospirillum magneticum]